MKFLLTFITCCLMMPADAQTTLCNDWMKVTDSISSWNAVRMQIKQDTIFTKSMIDGKYKTLTLLGKKPSSVSSFIFWQIPMDSLAALQDCFGAWSASNAWTLVQQPADAAGFSRVSLYADKKQQQRVALYDRYSLDSSRITVGLSLMWTRPLQK